VPANRKLVIVESPAKARTIESYLGSDFDVEASIGHVRDLPQPSELPKDMKKGPFGRFAVNVENDFEPYYVVEPEKKRTVTELRKALAGADELYLATDEDREGEAIAWHLLQVLKPKVPVYRMVFHEITRDAIGQALANPRQVDTNLVDAQETRRILDRLYGYEVSPVLWRKVRAGLSAGRVQSVATRLVVERERERIAFQTAEYWDITATMTTTAGSSFEAKLLSLDGAKVATGKDFDDSGRLAATGSVQLGQSQAQATAANLSGAAFEVQDLATKPYRRRPAAPFTTSTLQQEASRKLRMNSRQTMRVAQSLYESGHITYMRTDSTNLSNQAVAAARRQATELYGADSVSPSPRVYANKSKGAQEAHEAIRPSGDRFAMPAELAGRLNAEQRKLYDLIWKRTVASQMTDATGQTVSVRLGAALPDGRPVIFGAAGTVITHRGFLAAYEEGRDASRYGEDRDGTDVRLPQMTQGETVTASDLVPAGHQTSPPPRFTEASLVAALEQRGIGRPSTYAATVSVIEDRGYVFKRGLALVPTWLAFSVTRLLEQSFADLVDYDFTAEMEAGLDQIAAGEAGRVAWLRDFYFGADPTVPAPPGGSLKQVGLKRLVEDLGEIDARDINTVELGNGISLRVGRYGPYVERPPAGDEGEAKRVSVPTDLAPDELTLAKARELLEAEAETDRPLGQDPATGHEVVVKNGRFGPFVSLLPPPAADGEKKAPKARNASLFKSMDPATVSLEQALRLLSLPRVVGQDAAGETITAQNGRFGPYIKCGTQSRSLDHEEQLFSLTEDEARAIMLAPKPRRGAAAGPLRELGDDPATGKKVVVKDGRFGPYVTDGQTNATLRKGDDPEQVTLERAAELLADKRARPPAKRRTAARSTGRKTTGGGRSRSTGKKK